MNWESLLTGAIGAAVVSGVFKLIELYSTRNDRKAELAKTNAEAFNLIMQGGEKAVAGAMLLVNEYQESNAAFRLEVSGLKTIIESMQIDEVSKTKRLIARLEAQEEYIKLLVTIMAENKIVNIPPMPDILTETDPKIKAIR